MARSHSRVTNFWEEVADRLEAGEHVHTVLVAANSAHSPGTRGAKLAVFEDGTVAGTMGGGAMEAAAIERGKQVLAGRQRVREPQTLVHRKKGSGDKSGLICAGEQSNVLYTFAPADAEIVREAAHRVAEDGSGVLELRAEAVRIREGSPSRNTGPIELVGDPWVYAEQLLNMRRVAIIGGGHVGLAVSKALSELGYVVSIFEVRADVFTLRENEFSRHKVVVDDYADAAGLISHSEITHVLVMTADLPSDVRALRGLYGLDAVDFPYIGLMGSPAKIAKIFDELRDEGVGDEELARIYAPIGLPMTSNTPQEIAISVAAQLLTERAALFGW